MQLRFPRGFQELVGGFGDVDALVERFNLRRVYYWLFLAGLVGVVGGAGALTFKWLLDQAVTLFWGAGIGRAPSTAGGEPAAIHVVGSFRLWMLVVAPTVGGLISAFLVYRFAPEAEGHGTDAAIRAYHRQRGQIRARTPIIKILASAFTLGSGGSAGREGPIAQIGAGFGSILGGWLGLSDRERRVLLAAGVSAGIGAIFRAPLAGAIFAAEVLYREPDIEAEVVVPALLSSIVSYSIYCAVHGFGHLFTGTGGFTFDNPQALLCYAVLGVVTAFCGIAFVAFFDWTTRRFKAWNVSPYLKPAMGGAAVGTIGLAAYLVSHDDGVLAVMGSGYGTLQHAVSEQHAIGPALAILVFVAFGKMVTTSLSIGSGGSGGVFGPSVVIGGCLGAAVGTIFHAWFPSVVPDVGPFTIVAMAGFFAGVAKTPISTLIMVGDLTGNYSLLLPSMLVVCLSMIITHRWTIYPEQVRMRVESPAHRDELLHDVLEGLRVKDALPCDRRVRVLEPATPLGDLLANIREDSQHVYPIVERGRFLGVVTVDQVRCVLGDSDLDPDLVVAQDLMTDGHETATPEDPLLEALELLALQNYDGLPIVSSMGTVIGVLDRRDVMSAYRHRLSELRRS